MLKNYFRVAYRTIVNQKGYSFINIFGLAVGIACCLLILLYLFKELSYDRFNKKSDRTYRLVQAMKSDSRTDKGATTPFLAGPSLASEYPQLVEASVRFYNLQVSKLSLGIKEEEKYFKEPNFFFVDSTMFDVFTVNMVRGNPKTALNDPQSVILTEAMAKKYFGDEDPMGKQLFFEGRINLTVTGVMEEWPENSHMKIDFLGSFTTLDNFYKNEYEGSWYWNPCWTYILLRDKADLPQLEDQLPLFADKYYKPNIPSTDHVELSLQPLADIHLHSNRDQEMQANSNIRYVYLFSIVAVLILVIACINFMNLATARSVGRSREIGVRKVFGSSRWRLFGQFMGEAYLMSLLAFILAVLLVYLSLPFFNELLNTHLPFSFFDNGWIMGGLVVVFLIVGGLSGIYPAFFLSGFEPIKTLRGEFTKSGRGKLFRQTLVVVQFGFSILLIIGSVLVYRQLNLLREKNLGFDQEEIVMIPTELTRTIWYYKDFKKKLLQNSDIIQVTGTNNVLGSLKNTYRKYTPEDRAQELSIPSIFVMYDFIETYDIKLLAGRSFSKKYSTDRTQAVIINERAVEELEWGSPEEAIGKSLTYADQAHQVVGVTENFNHTSLRRKVEALVLDMPDGDYDLVSHIAFIAVKVNGQHVDQALQYMRSAWKEFDDSHPFDYFFHDQRLDQIYKKEATMANVSISFTVLAIIVACLGLFGLASFTTEKRTKEIGIRKTLGASITNIVSLLSKEFVILVLLANLVAWPIAYLWASEWLQNFPYRIDLGMNAVFIFLGSGLLALLIAVVTVSYQSIKAALVNPAKTIRDH